MERLRAYVGNEASDLKSAAVIRAAAEAVQAIAQKHEWNYYRTSGRINCSTPYQTGTIEYDHTGGTYERQLTLTGGTWPTWASYGTVVIANVPYDVDRRISDTVVTLRVNSCPSDDVAAGTSYQIYRARYDLPDNYVSMHKPIMTSQYFILSYITYDQFLVRRNLNDGTGQPLYFTIADNGYGRSQIMMWNPPDQEYQLEFEYKRKPYLPVVVDESTGTVNLTSGSLDLTGNSTLFTAAMQGAVIRVSYDQKPPTAFDSVNPPQFEQLIESYVSSTAMTLREAAAYTVNKRAYVISSRLDLMDGPMFDYCVQMGMKRLRIGLRINMVSGEDKDYERAERAAKDADGQLYNGVDRAVVEQCSPYRRPFFGSWTRTIPGNG